MLEQLLRRFRPVRFVDPVFGHLRYQRNAGFWEGSVMFVPDQHAVEVLVDAPISGPTDGQRLALKALQAGYPDIEDAIVKALERACKRTFVMRNSGHLRGMVATESFVLRCIDIPEIVAGRFRYELTFDGTASGAHYVVPIVDGIPGNARVEEC